MRAENDEMISVRLAFAFLREVRRFFRFFPIIILIVPIIGYLNL